MVPAHWEEGPTSEEAIPEEPPTLEVVIPEESALVMFRQMALSALGPEDGVTSVALAALVDRIRWGKETPQVFRKSM